jgi:hypothetical protein
MVLYSYMCVCAFSLHRESPGMILGDKPLLVEGGSVTIAARHELIADSHLRRPFHLGRRTKRDRADPLRSPVHTFLAETP